jgi:hypothetical protein
MRNYTVSGKLEEGSSECNRMASLMFAIASSYVASLRVAALQSGARDKKTVRVAFDDDGKRVVLYGFYCSASRKLSIVSKVASQSKRSRGIRKAMR